MNHYSNYSHGKASNAGLENVHVCMNVHYFWADISPRHIPLACLSCDVIQQDMFDVALKS